MDTKRTKEAEAPRGSLERTPAARKTRMVSAAPPAGAFRRAMRAGGTVLVALACSLPAAASAADDYVWSLTGNRPRMRQAQRLEAIESAQPVTVTVGLAWRNPNQLDQLLREVASPQSPRFQQYLTAAEFDAAFSPSVEDVAVITQHLESNGFTIARISPDRLLVTAVGNADAVRRAFGTRLARFNDGQRHFYAPDADPALPPTVGQRVVSIAGLENRIQMRPNGSLRALAMLPRADGKAPYGPGDIAGAYNFGPVYDEGIRGYTSRASTIGIMTAYGFNDADITEFWQAFDIDRSLDSITVVPIGTGAVAVGDETTLDVAWASAMAPGAPVIVYESTDTAFGAFMEMYNRAVSDNRAAVLSTSWGACESTMPKRYIDQAHAVFQKAAALGISVLAASGDAGAYDCGPSTIGVDFPASHPLVTAVGGTSLRMTRDGGYDSESAWSGSGGGVSVVWPQPPWQQEPSGRRGLPDIAFNADPATGYYLYYNGTWWQYGGTSVAAPCWAALIALGNQKRESVGRPTLGVPGPRLCELGHDMPHVFRDVLAGDNKIYQAKRGWDHVTGWGSPDAHALVAGFAEHDTSTEVDDRQAIVAILPGTGDSQTGVARAAFSSRCANGMLDMKINSVPAGTYDLTVGDEVVHSVSLTSSGAARLRIPTVDPRGRVIALRARDSARTLFSGLFPPEARPPLAVTDRLSLPFDPGNLVGIQAGRAAAGTVRYRARNGLANFVVRVSGLTATQYNLIVGTTKVATFDVQSTGGGSTAATVRFDTRPWRGTVLTFDPHCQPIRVTRRGTTYLEIPALGAGRGNCPS